MRINTTLPLVSTQPLLQHTYIDSLDSFPKLYDSFKYVKILAWLVCGCIVGMWWRIRWYVVQSIYICDDVCD